MGILFAFVAKRGYAASNPIEGIERPEIGDSEIRAFSVQEASKLLASADEDARPILAIGLFAGLRMSEILALHWEEVDLCERTITVQGRGGKNSATAGRHDFGKPVSLARFESDQRGFWGWYNRRLALDVPRNALRHSFGSYHYALHKNENLTAAEMGNSPSIVFRHYRAVVTAQAAKEYWQLVPTNVSADLGDFSVA